MEFQMPSVTGVRNTISENDEKFKPESGRYHLYIALSCPFAHRALIGMNLKGLKNHIGLSIVHPTMQKTKPGIDEHRGWVFRKETDDPITPVSGYGSFPCDYCIPDPVNNAKNLRELYELAGAPTTKYSVPVLWDKKEKTMVNNESADILRIFNCNFNEFASNKELDLYPEHLRAQIDEINDLVSTNVNVGVYKCGYAKQQSVYETNVKNLFGALDKLEEILSKGRYLCGDQFTEADIKLWTTLLRFDEVYFVLFKCNRTRIVDFPNLLNWCREIYQMPGITETVYMDYIKNSYFGNYLDLNPYSIVPIGDDFLGQLQKPHNRK
jgi:putative glutathione S-transferase